MDHEDHTADDHTPAPASSDDGRDAAHRVPDDVSQETVEALGKLSEALESVDRARGHLYSFHQLTGKADIGLQDAVEALERAGHTATAERLRTELVGRNVIAGRWTFQMVEDYDDNYWSVFRDLERQAREAHAHGRRHLYEAQLKEDERTRGQQGHEATPEQL